MLHERLLHLFVCLCRVTHFDAHNLHSIFPSASLIINTCTYKDTHTLKLIYTLSSADALVLVVALAFAVHIFTLIKLFENL